MRALDSVAACGWPEDRVEIVIAPDDGAPYAAHADGWGRRVILPPGPVASGPGPTRNRALAAATGQVVAFLDADDSWAPGYLAALVPLALAHGAAFGRTEVRDKDAVLMTVPSGATLGFDDLGGGASFHPVLRRDWAGPFANAPSQDVFHAVEALSLAGGCAPVGAATYRLHVTPGSATSGADYGARVAAAYAEYGQRIRSGASRVPPRLAGPGGGCVRPSGADQCRLSAKGFGARVL